MVEPEQDVMQRNQILYQNSQDDLVIEEDHHVPSLASPLTLKTTSFQMELKNTTPDGKVIQASPIQKQNRATFIL